MNYCDCQKKQVPQEGPCWCEVLAGSVERGQACWRQLGAGSCKCPAGMFTYQVHLQAIGVELQPPCRTHDWLGAGVCSLLTQLQLKASCIKRNLLGDVQSGASEETHYRSMYPHHPSSCNSLCRILPLPSTHDAEASSEKECTFLTSVSILQ